MLDPALGPVVDHHLQGAQHGHAAQRMAVVVGPHERLQQLDLVDAVHPGHADVGTELPDGLGRVAPPAQAPQGWQAGGRPSRPPVRP